MNCGSAIKLCCVASRLTLVQPSIKYSLQLRKMSSTAKIIGFAGVTNGGKTTISRWLKTSLQQQGVDVTHFNMDAYYWDENSPMHVPLPEFDNKYANWDDVCAVNWEQLNSDVRGWRNRTKAMTENKQVLLVEGIMIYNHRDLLPYFDKKYFFTLPKDECWDRRRKRNYLPPEPEGYFEKIAWPYYIKLKQSINSQNDIVFVDGTRDQKQIFSEVRDQIQELLAM